MEVILPKVTPDETVAFGLLKFGRFSTLNASARNCNCDLSVSRKSLNTDVSTLKNPGPRKLLRPRLPKYPLLLV